MCSYRNRRICAYVIQERWRIVPISFHTGRDSAAHWKLHINCKLQVIQMNESILKKKIIKLTETKFGEGKN